MSKTDDDYYKGEILNRDDGGSDRDAGEKSVVKCSTSAGSFSIRLHKVSVVLLVRQTSQAVTSYSINKCTYYVTHTGTARHSTAHIIS